LGFPGTTVKHCLHGASDKADRREDAEEARKSRPLQGICAADFCMGAHASDAEKSLTAPKTCSLKYESSAAMLCLVACEISMVRDIAMTSPRDGTCPATLQTYCARLSALASSHCIIKCEEGTA